METYEKFMPIKDRILVKENEREGKSDGGIIIRAESLAMGSKTGCVIAVGPDVKSVKVGDNIFLEWHAGQLVKIGKELHIVIKEENVLMTYE